MALVVQKYGGTSVGTVEKIRNVARRVSSHAVGNSQQNGSCRHLLDQETVLVVFSHPACVGQSESFHWRNGKQLLL